ncbi:MAG: NUDIX domain-containing protein [Clostridiales bacterium]|nr:NUDIX domain-containing protein [Clostridiales bacterium]
MMVKVVDIYDASRHKAFSKTSVKCRGMVIKDSHILISHEVNTDYYSIPGGGLEEGETLEECCAREVREETGYIVKPACHVLTINAYYKDRKNISHYFLCDIIEKTERSLTAEEIELGLISNWMDTEKALELFSKYDNFVRLDEDKYRIYLREYTALREYFRMLKY